MSKRTSRSMSKMLVLLLTLSLVAGILPVFEQAYAASEFKYGSPFSKTGYDTYYHPGRFADNLIVKRPGTGISPMRWYDVLGKTAPRDFAEDECIEADIPAQEG